MPKERSFDAVEWTVFIALAALVIAMLPPSCSVSISRIYSTINGGM